jgi:hypothetical protein
MESSQRERTRRGLEFLEHEFGARPRLYANHGENRENLYWGAKRFHTPVLRSLLGAARFGRGGRFSGEDPDSPYFWGDLCRERIDYVRSFTFSSLNVCETSPRSPYRLSTTPYVKSWFCTADASDVEIFRRRVTREAVDRLEEVGGACILSTHLGKYFVRDGRVDPEVDERLRYIAGKRGWFVPVSTLLDHLRERASEGKRPLGVAELARLEIRFLVDRLRSHFNTPSGTYP